VEAKGASKVRKYFNGSDSLNVKDIHFALEVNTFLDKLYA
jgi:hypothetical protein